mgnify:CR=1 FL=1
MKRDMELVRKILIAAEEKQDFQPQKLEIDGYSQEEISYHIKIMTQAGLIESQGYATSTGIPLWCIKSLTWEGHEFLDAARNEKVWTKVKKKIAEEGGSIPFDVLKHVLKQTTATLFLG